MVHTGTSAAVPWHGHVLSVQPRIRLTRSFDQRSHSYLGYVLRVQGLVAGRQASFSVGIGPAAQVRHAFRVGDEVAGVTVPVPDPRTEPVEYYRASGLQLLARGDRAMDAGPPWLGVAPDLAVYRQRGHRRLDPRTYDTQCGPCLWGCRMAVEIIVDQWAPERKRYRQETFCYGPKNCRLYRAGPTRKVPGQKGMVWEEEDRVDEDAIAHRTEEA